MKKNKPLPRILRYLADTTEVRTVPRDNCLPGDRLASFPMTWMLLSLSIAGMAFSLPAQAGTNYVPMLFDQVSGTRPFVDMKLNDRPFRFMVHANAGFHAMTNHANAISAGITDFKDKERYGIVKPGVVSDLGRSKVVADTISVGTDVMRQVPLDVFETPVETMQGMLGIKWLRDRHVIVDYDQARLGIADTVRDAEQEDKRLLAEGYVAHKMTWDPQRSEYLVDALVDRRPAKLVVSTVAENVLDSHFAASYAIALGPVVERYAGPAGATGVQHLAKKPVSISMDGQALNDIQPRIFSLADYSSGRATGDVVIAGWLGADFMLANQAVIDFGTERLFVRSR